jgi:Protein of unknown function (DUF4240)
MVSQYHLSVDNINNNFLESLREHYPHAQLEINVKPQETVEGLTENGFWNLIALFDWSDFDNDDAIIKRAVQTLAEMPVRCIYEFQDILSAKLHALDTRKHAENTGENAFHGKDSNFSVDEFLYARCCCVANGKTFYETVLNDPISMPKDLSFEAILTVAHKAYLLKTGKQFRYVPTHNIETFANKNGWAF